jgi:putative ATPase
VSDLFERAFEEKRRPRAPLADRMRPRALEEVVGQARILGPESFFRQVIESGELPSLVLWGPPGSGKTTLARLFAEKARAHFETLSATSSGIKDLRDAVARAEERLRFEGRPTILFVDEIHRFNKAQQDALLPHVEAGIVRLFGATTENPSFEVIAPLLSRTKVLVLEALSRAEIETILERALCDAERGLGKERIRAAEGALAAIANLSSGDARAALNLLELATRPLARRPIEARVLTPELVKKAAQRRDLKYDRAGEEHYNIISALHKSLRGSDPDAGLYWLGRMLEAGEDPLYVARRLVRFASEDVGLADPQALVQAVAAMHAVDLVGMPEGALALAQAVVYLGLAPKSNALYRAYGEVVKDIAELPSYPVPLPLRNATAPLMKALGYGENYLYPHGQPEALVGQDYFPPELAGRVYYRPAGRGAERELGAALERIKRLREGLKKRRAAEGEGRGAD